MTDERARRKMSAILSADVKVYSRLMSADDMMGTPIILVYWINR